MHIALSCEKLIAFLSVWRPDFSHIQDKSEYLNKNLYWARIELDMADTKSRLTANQQHENAIDCCTRKSTLKTQ